MVKSFFYPVFLLCLVLSAVCVGVPCGFCEDAGTDAGAFAAAQEAFSDGSYERAAVLLDRFLRTFPDSSWVPHAKLLIGQTLFHRNRFLEALQYFEGLLDQPAMAALQDSVLYWTAQVHFQGNNFTRAASFYRDILEQYPSSHYAAAARYSLGWALFEEGAYAEALKEFIGLESRGVHEPFLEDTPLKIVECLYHLQDYAAVKQRVARTLSRSLQGTAQEAYLFFYLAESEYNTDNYTAAVAAYEKSAQASTDPRMRALARLGAVWSLIKMKEYSRAEALAGQTRVQDLEKPNQDILLLGRAVINAGLGRQEEAQEVYERLVRESADPVIAAHGQAGRADALYEKGEYAAAVAGYERALSTAGELSETAGIRDSIRNGLAWARLKTGDYQAALAEFEKIAADSGDDSVQVAALCQIADAYQESGDGMRAQELYDRILLEHGESRYVDYCLYRQGLLLLRSSADEAAVERFEQLLQRFPQSALLDKATYALGLARFQLASYTEASAILRRFRTEFTDSSVRPQALYLLGIALRNLKEFQEALEVFAGIAAQYESDRDLCLKSEYQIADCHFRGGDEKQALAMFKRLRSKYPDASLTADIMWWLGDYYYRMRKPDIARRYFQALIDDFPGNPLAGEAHYALGLSLEEESLHQEAIEHFQQVIMRGRSSLAARAVQQIGEIYAKKGRNVEAAAFMSRNLDVVPSEEEAALHMAIAQQLEAGGKPGEAIDEYLKAAYLFPDNKEIAVRAYFRVAQLYETDNRIPEAAAFYDRIIGLKTVETKIAQERLDALSARLQSQPLAARP